MKDLSFDEYQKKLVQREETPEVSTGDPYSFDEYQKKLADKKNGAGKKPKRSWGSEALESVVNIPKTLSTAAEGIGDAVVFGLPEVIAQGAEQVFDENPRSQDDWKDALIKRKKTHYAQKPKMKDGEDLVLPSIPYLFPDGGMSQKDLAEGLESLPYSAVGMGGSLAGRIGGATAGFATAGPAGIVPGQTAGAISGSMAALTPVARNQIERQLIDTFEKTKKRKMTDEETEALLTDFERQIEIHTAGEVIPEAVGNAFEIGILAKIIGKTPAGTSLLKKIGKKSLLAMQSLGMELGTETLTTQIQQPQEIKMGMRPGETPRSMTKGEDWLTSLQDVAPAVVALQGVMGGGAVATGLFRDSLPEPRVDDTGRSFLPGTDNRGFRVDQPADLDDALSDIEWEEQSRASRDYVQGGQEGEREYNQYNPDVPGNLRPGTEQSAPTETAPLTPGQTTVLNLLKGSSTPVKPQKGTPVAHLNRLVKLGLAEVDEDGGYRAIGGESQTEVDESVDNDLMYDILETEEDVQQQADTRGRKNKFEGLQDSETEIVDEDNRQGQSDYDKFQAAQRETGATNEVIDNPDSLAHGEEMNTAPSEKQKEAENYKTVKKSVDGLKLSIENPAGTTRSGTDGEGREWSQEMQTDYGRILGTKGADKDHVDAFVAPGYKGEGEHVHVINQHNEDGSFDEHKTVLGATNEKEALDLYNSNYEEGWDGGKSVTQMPIAEFKEWVTGKDPAKGELKHDSTIAVREIVAEESPVARDVSPADVTGESGIDTSEKILPETEEEINDTFAELLKDETGAELPTQEVEKEPGAGMVPVAPEKGSEVTDTTVEVRKAATEEIKANGGQVSFDNPGGGWLANEIERAKKKEQPTGLRSGSVTSTVRDVSLPVDFVEGLKGMTGEENRMFTDTATSKIEKLSTSIKEKGYDEKNPIFINVGHDGTVLINEGNHRARAAKQAGLENVPVSISYFAGGERVAGDLSLDKLAQLSKGQESPAAVKIPEKSGIEYTKTVKTAEGEYQFEPQDASIARYEAQAQKEKYESLRNCLSI